MSWKNLYHGDGQPRDAVIPPSPPWREFPPPVVDPEGRGLFQPPEGLTDAVNAALCLRRPLLLTGAPGSGKSTVIDSVARELNLGRVLRWHITSRSTLVDAEYRYDALGRIHANRLAIDEGQGVRDDIAPFLQLGPLGTALIPAKRPRALLIDEIDKSDLDLPSDLLDILERGLFEIPELARYHEDDVSIREWDSTQTYQVHKGIIRCTEFPFIVMTSNGERDFPAPFLRRCIRFAMPDRSITDLTNIVAAHLGAAAAGSPVASKLIDTFFKKIRSGSSLAVDQLLNAVFVLAGNESINEATRERLEKMLTQELGRG